MNMLIYRYFIIFYLLLNIEFHSIYGSITADRCNANSNAGKIADVNLKSIAFDLLYIIDLNLNFDRSVANSNAAAKRALNSAVKRQTG